MTRIGIARRARPFAPASSGEMASIRVLVETRGQRGSGGSHSGSVTCQWRPLPSRSMEWLSLTLGVVGVVAGLPALVLAVRAERRMRERHVVEWVVSFCRHGQLQIDNSGPDTARRVQVRIETSEGVTEAHGPQDVKANESLSYDLPETLLRRLGAPPFYAHVRTDWETDRGTVRSVCQTVERPDPPVLEHSMDAWPGPGCWWRPRRRRALR